jgi:hypothetical protein
MSTLCPKCGCIARAATRVPGYACDACGCVFRKRGTPKPSQLVSRIQARWGLFSAERATGFTFDLWPRNAYLSSCTWCRREFWSTKYLNACFGPTDGPHARYAKGAP